MRAPLSALPKNGSLVCACWIFVISVVAIPDLQHSNTTGYSQLEFNSTERRVLSPALLTWRDRRHEALR
ncbi:hypothetical protein FHT72_006691 [Rhizobium sp. BK077]|nr:hypothetical protein [Rhizobium sp. BK112]MBB3372157.1 hypothetical protein [Rhizobium sp. BK077]MBB4182586.1 hypothetical protein [Rhizobium sp. BK109]